MASSPCILTPKKSCTTSGLWRNGKHKPNGPCPESAGLNLECNPRVQQFRLGTLVLAGGLTADFNVDAQQGAMETGPTEGRRTHVRRAQAGKKEGSRARTF